MNPAETNEPEAIPTLVDPYARKVAHDASALEERAKDADRNGMGVLAKVLRQRISKMVKRAAQSEANARAQRAAKP